MQITVFFIAYTKKLAMLSLRVIIICSVRVGLQITLRLLSSSLGNTVLLHTLFLEYETQIGKRKKWTMFFNRIAVHMQNFLQIGEKSKNGQFCTLQIQFQFQFQFI